MNTELCLHQLFARQAAHQPDAPAVRDDKEELSYRQLDEQSDRLAALLTRETGSGPARIGLHLRRGNAVVVAILAVLKAGCAYVPLDPTYPAERVQYMADDAAVDLVLTDADGAAAAPAGRRVLVIDSALWTEETAACDELPWWHRSHPPMSSTPPAPAARPRASRSRTAM